MGSYTTVEYSDIEVANMAGLKKYLEDVKAGKYKPFTKKHKDRYSRELNYESFQQWANALEIKEDTLNFSGWSGWKIISYWYDELVILLRDLAIFIDGEVYLEFESHEEGGKIEFDDGECTIHTGTMEWHSNTAEDFTNLPKLKKALETQLTVRRI